MMLRIFVTAFFLFKIAGYTMESQSLLPYFQEIPKAELHLHLGGSYPLNYLLTIASDAQKEALLKNLESISRKIDYHEGFKVFGLIAEIVNTDEKIEQGIRALCQELKEDGVIYVEVRTGLKDLGSGIEGYLQTVLRGMRQEASERFHARLLLSLKRASSAALARSTVDLAIKYKDLGVVGIDVSGDSTLGQIGAIVPELIRAKEAGLFLTVHMGESAKEQGQKEILEVLRPHRIGHGVHLNPDAAGWILENRVPIEICPTSSVLVQMVDDYSAHPGLLYYLQGHPIVICTDDPLLFQHSLSQELCALSEYTFLNFDQLRQIVKKSLDHAFLSEEEKQKILVQIGKEPNKIR